MFITEISSARSEHKYTSVISMQVPRKSTNHTVRRAKCVRIYVTCDADAHFNATHSRASVAAWRYKLQIRKFHSNNPNVITIRT